MFRCFNGAATFRSRKAAAYGPELSGWQELQWGRDLSVAEGHNLRDIAKEMHKLQWGRDLSVAEGRPGPVERQPGRAASMGPRPFGRGRLAPAAMQGHTRARFNGAATFRSRKANGLSTLIPLALLQWGRDLSVAEGRGLAAGARRQFVASMGPRPFGRGRFEASDSRKDTSSLQWGRDLSVAEGRPRRRRSALRGRRASMGPRPFGRGRRLAGLGGGARRAASMGPRPFGRGRGYTAAGWRVR